MASFFDKLKKGMGIEGIEGNVREESPQSKAKKKKVPKSESPKELKIAPKKIEIEPAEIKVAPKEEKITKEVKISKPAVEEKQDWPDKPAGQLAIDVYQTEKELVIQSAIAGIRAENLEISIERDVVSIRGVREKPAEEDGDYFTQECYWGHFARELIVPVEVDPDRAEALMKENVLTIRIPKILREKKRTIKVKI